MTKIDQLFFLCRTEAIASTSMDHIIAIVWQVMQWISYFCVLTHQHLPLFACCDFVVYANITWLLYPVCYARGRNFMCANDQASSSLWSHQLSIVGCCLVEMNDLTWPCAWHNVGFTISPSDEDTRFCTIGRLLEVDWRHVLSFLLVGVAWCVVLWF